VDTSNFAIQLFAEFPDEYEFFGEVYGFYSIKHRFSKWLIANREKLQKELPKLYDKILEIMIKSEDESEVIEGLNGRLYQLKNYKNNMFDVTESLYLTDSDFS